MNEWIEKVICILQASLLIIGVILGVGRAECEVSIHGGSDVGIDCKKKKKMIIWKWENEKMRNWEIWNLK